MLGKAQKAMTELSKTFRLWPDNAEKMIKTEEDQKFLESMKTERVATFGCFDGKLSQQAQHKENTIHNQERLREKDGDL